MPDQFVITTPKNTAISFSPNPVAAGATVSVSVTVEEITVQVLTERASWEEVESGYPTWADVEGAPWWNVEWGVTYPSTDRSVTLSIAGITVGLTDSGAGGVWTGSFDAPEVTSWFESGHKYYGMVTAMGGFGTSDTATAEDFPELGLRVLEQGAPEIAVAKPVEWLLFATLTPPFVWTVYDEISGIDTNSISVSIDGIAHSGIALEPEGAGGYRCTYIPAADLSEGAHTVAFGVSDNDGNTAAHSVNFVTLFFITDRTQSDVDRVKYLSSRQYPYEAEDIGSFGFMTASEKEEWDGDLRGAYNASDMNRVGTAVYYLQSLMQRYISPYAMPSVTAKRDWAVADIPTPSQLDAYLDDVQAVRVQLPIPSGGLAVPADMEAFSFDEANTLERILEDACVYVEWAIDIEPLSRRNWSDVESLYDTWGAVEGTAFYQVEFIDAPDLMLPWLT